MVSLWVPIFLLVAPLSGLFAEVSPALERADAAYQNRLDVTQCQMALELYQTAIEEEPSRLETYWKGARAAWWAGDLSSNRKEKITFFQLGIQLAKDGLNKSTECAPCHFWLGANYGSFGESKGILKSLFLVKPIRNEMESVLQLDETLEGGGAHRILGVVDYKVPGFAGGNHKRAEEHLLKAYTLDPYNPFNLYYLVEYYWTVKNKEEARKYLGELDQLTVPQDQQPERVRMMEKAADIRKKLDR